MLRLFSNVLQQLNNLVVVVNQGGEIDYVGPSVERMLGYKAHELLGDKWWLKTCSNIADPEKRKKEVQCFFEQVAKGSNAITSVEHKLNTAGGEARWVLWNISSGPKNTLVHIGYDITDRKRAEQEIINKNKELFNRNREIYESLHYAKNIQQAILPSAEKLKGNFGDSFALYKPKDVVSGDLYWANTVDKATYVAVVDCTGHGVPGALMTMTANALLKEVIVKRKVNEPAKILAAIDEELEQVLNAHGNNAKANDGMDIALIKYEKEKSIVTFAGAFRPLILVKEKTLTEYLGSRYPIGFYHDVEKIFEQQEIMVEKGDTLYMFTDGYTDQFGGADSKKFNKKNLKELFVSINDMGMAEQKSYLEYSLLNWRQKEPQTDDVLVAGLKI